MQENGLKRTENNNMLFTWESCVSSHVFYILKNLEVEVLI